MVLETKEIASSMVKFLGYTCFQQATFSVVEFIKNHHGFRQADNEEDVALGCL